MRKLKDMLGERYMVREIFTKFDLDYGKLSSFWESTFLCIYIAIKRYPNVYNLHKPRCNSCGRIIERVLLGQKGAIKVS